MWKWGSNWGGKKNASHYDFMKDEGIIVGIDRFRYSLGDLVVITDGHTVKAITMVEEEPKPITENSYYPAIREQYKINHQDDANFAKAEWYELPEDKTFQYKLERGAAKIGKSEIKEKVLKLWNSRNQ